MDNCDFGCCRFTSIEERRAELDGWLENVEGGGRGNDGGGWQIWVR